jgi:glycosyltransferase involved in cell wall biosynthesis
MKFMSKKINILYLIDILYNDAGTEKNLFLLVTNLNKDLFNPIVCPLEPVDSPMIQNFRAQGITVKPLPLKKVYGFDAIKQAFKLCKIIKQEKITIVQVIHFSSEIFGTLVSRFAKVPVLVASRRDMGFAENNWHQKFFRRFSNRFVDVIITNSDAVKNQVGKIEKIPNRKMATIYNGINFTEDENSIIVVDKISDFPLPISKPLIGCVANIRPIKGLEYFIAAAAEVTRQYPSAQFIIVGGDADASDEEIISNYKKKLSHLIKKFELESHLFFLQRRADVKDILKILTVFVLPSLSEGFSNAIIEAMAASLPVVATKVGGNAEAVVDNETGILVPPKDAAAIAKAVVKLLKQPKLAKQMGKAGKERMKQLFTIERMTGKMEEFYTSLVQAKQPRT